MTRTMMNTTAMRATLVLIGGEAWANSVAALYQALDNAETRGFNEGQLAANYEAFGEGYDSGHSQGYADTNTTGIFDDGYEMGYEDGREAGRDDGLPFTLEDLKEATEKHGWMPQGDTPEVAQAQGRYHTLPAMQEQHVYERPIAL